MNWIDLGNIEEIPLRGARTLKTAVGCVAIFRTGEVEAFAVSNRCPHKGGPLSEGIVHDRKVTCPLHNWVFDLTTGEAQGADDGRIATFPVRIEDGRLLIDADTIAKRAAA